MNKDEILRMARKAGFSRTEAYNGVDVFLSVDSELERFAALVAAAERKACAQLVEASPSYDWHRFACEAAAAIRARGEK